MKRLALTVTLLALSASFEAQTKPPVDPVLEVFLPNCAESILKSEPFRGRLAAGMTAESFSLESSDPTCHFDAVRVRTTDGKTWVGNPWPLYTVEQGTPAEKIKAIAWKALQKSVIAEAGTVEGSLQKMRVNHVVEGGRYPVDGYVDTSGTLYFAGEFAKNAQEMRSRIDARLAPVIATAPARGPKSAPVEIIEFSDFQCPSCKRGSDAFEPYYEKNAGKIHYVRIDMPIISMHPWAFPAAVIGRAIWKQSPDAFWEYKKAVYSSQADLSAFEIDQFGRHFAEDHGLDLKRYDADVTSEGLRKEILDGLGTAFTLGVAATPTYFVNGVAVATGPESAHLKSYLDKVLSGK